MLTASETIQPVRYTPAREHLLQLEAFHRLFDDADKKLAAFDAEHIAYSLIAESEELIDDADYRLSAVVTEAHGITTAYWHLRQSRVRNDEQQRELDRRARHLREDVEAYAAVDADWHRVARGWDESRHYAIQVEGV